MSNGIIFNWIGSDGVGSILGCSLDVRGDMISFLLNEVKDDQLRAFLTANPNFQNDSANCDNVSSGPRVSFTVSNGFAEDIHSFAGSPFAAVADAESIGAGVAADAVFALTARDVDISAAGAPISAEALSSHAAALSAHAEAASIHANAASLHAKAAEAHAREAALHMAIVNAADKKTDASQPSTEETTSAAVNESDAAEKPARRSRRKPPETSRRGRR